MLGAEDFILEARTTIEGLEDGNNSHFRKITAGNVENEMK